MCDGLVRVAIGGGVVRVTFGMQINGCGCMGVHDCVVVELLGDLHFRHNTTCGLDCQSVTLMVAVVSRVAVTSTTICV